MIQIENLDFAYGGAEFGLRIRQLSIAPGSTVAITGPSGSGKTTLLLLLSGVFRPTAGRILVNGRDLGALGESERRQFRICTVGFIFQNFELIDYLDVRENILLPFLINRSLRLNAAVRRSAETLADSVGLSEKLNRPITQLSRGEQQRVALCRALLPGPKLILADEPTAGLDAANAERAMEQLWKHAIRIDATVVCVTHDISLLDRFDRVLDISTFLEPTPSLHPRGAN